MASERRESERSTYIHPTTSSPPTPRANRNSQEQPDSPNEETQEIIINIEDSNFTPHEPERNTNSPNDDNTPLSPSGISEISRVLKVHTNYYAVLKVPKTATDQEIRNSFLKISRLVHPDKCQDPRAHHAAAILNTAYTTLKNPIKRALYDRYVSDARAATVSYGEWEVQADQRVQLPTWMQKLLACPGGPICIGLLMLALVPVALAAVVLSAVFVLLLLPVKGAVVGYHKLQEAREERRRNQSFVGARVSIPYHRDLDTPKGMDTEMASMSQQIEVVTHKSDTPSISPRKMSVGDGAGQSS